MTNRRLVMIILGAFICLALLEPIGTELEVQSAMRNLRGMTSIKESIEEFGNPSRTDKDDANRILADRLSLDVTPNEYLFVFNREGFPYWAIYVVSADGVTIKDWAVDRYW